MSTLNPDACVQGYVHSDQTDILIYTEIANIICYQSLIITEHNKSFTQEIHLY